MFVRSTSFLRFWPTWSVANSRELKSPTSRTSIYFSLNILVVLICIFLMVNDVQQMKRCLLYISFGKTSPQILCPFKISGYLSCYCWIVILFIYSSFLSHIRFTNTFPMLWLSFHFIDSIFWSTDFLILMKSNLSNLSIYFSLVACLYVIPKNPLPNPRS